MATTILCPNCSVVLNVPADAIGRRLRCPKCQTRFQAGTGAPSTSPTATARGTAEIAPPSVDNLKRPPSVDFDLPVAPIAPGSLREQFDIPLLSEPASKPAAGGAQGDALALFQDDPPARKRPRGAEARMQARRCPTCGGYVPQGMSLCSNCGIDIDTGRRVDLMEDITGPAPTRSTTPPIGVILVGSLALMGSVVLTLISFLMFQKGVTGAQLLLVPCLFGIYAAVQFLRNKSIKLLVIALTIGAIIDVMLLVAMPLYTAYDDVQIVARPHSDNPDDDDVKITSPIDRFDSQKFTWGIALLVGYAAVCVYLNSPPVRRHFNRQLG